jgi:hypothetical protein
MAKGKTGNTAKPEYNVWAMMIQRCENPNTENYPNYGGRGIKVCTEWYNFDNFYRDMGDRPEGMTLDRKDTNGDYSKDNCQWSDNFTQQNNKTNSVRFEYQGEMLTIPQIIRKTGTKVTLEMLLHRLKVMGMTVEQALTVPKMSHNIRRVLQIDNGVVVATHNSLADAGRALQVDKRVIHNALTGRCKKCAGFNWQYENS